MNFSNSRVGLWTFASVLIGLHNLFMNRPSVNALQDTCEIWAIWPPQEGLLKAFNRTIWCPSVHLHCFLHSVSVYDTHYSNIPSSFPWDVQFFFVSVSWCTFSLWCHKSYLEQDEGACPILCMEAVKNSIYLLPQPPKNASAVSVPV